MTVPEVAALTDEDRAYQEDVLAVMLEFSQMPYATDDGWMIEAMATRIVALQDALREAIRDNTANADALEAAQRRVAELEAALREIDKIDDSLANAVHAAALMALTARDALAAPHDAEEGSA